MALVPNDWSVVVIGHWNRAILSPAGISKWLFNLPEGTPVQVLVPLDVVAPYHIRHENVTVIPGNDRLIVHPVENNVDQLVQAIRIAQRALEHLPQTPVSAAGLNLRYKSEIAIDVIDQITANPWDDRISEEGLIVASRSIARSVQWRGGTITANIQQDQAGACSLLLNFDYRSHDSSKLKDWLDMTAADIKTQVDLLLQKTIGLSHEDFDNGRGY